MSGYILEFTNSSTFTKLIWIMFLFYVHILSFFKKRDTIQRGHYSRGGGIFLKEIRYYLLTERWRYYHCVLRALKSFKVHSRGQIYAFKSKIAQGIQKWVQTKESIVVAMQYQFKKIKKFGTKKCQQKLDIFLIFWILNFIFKRHPAV